MRRRLGVVLCSCLVATGAASAIAAPYGVNVHAPTGSDLEFLLDRVSAAGIERLRIDFIWAAVEVMPGVYDWSLYDELVAAASRRGLDVLAIVGYTPAWATDGEEIAGVPRDRESWVEFCRLAAARYRAGIRSWEIWNEPNLSHFWAGSREQYIEGILLAGADGLRAGNPEAVIVGPGLAHVVSGDADWYRWLTDVLVRAGERLDVLSHHAYDSDGHRDVTEKLAATTLFGNVPELWDVVPPSLREVLDRAGWSGPVWLTETGWASDEVGEASQARYYDGFLEEWLGGNAGRDWLEAVFFYEIRDDPSPGIRKFGLLRPDGSAKPAFDAYRDFIGRHAAAAGDPVLELVDGRFAIEVTWRDHRGRSGNGYALPFADSTGSFWFFDEENVELLVKVLDGRPLNDHFWLFYGALSDVEYWVRATDRHTGRTVTYHNPPRTLCGRADTVAFADGLGAVGGERGEAGRRAGVVGGCGGNDGALCLQQGRFRVEVEWLDHRHDRSGTATAIPRTDETGFFWFFRPGNLELSVKVLDGRPVNGRFWVFYGALTDLEYRIRVTDTQSGAVREYLNPAGELCGDADTNAF